MDTQKTQEQKYLKEDNSNQQQDKIRMNEETIHKRLQASEILSQINKIKSKSELIPNQYNDIQPQKQRENYILDGYGELLQQVDFFNYDQDFPFEHMPNIDKCFISDFIKLIKNLYEREFHFIFKIIDKKYKVLYQGQDLKANKNVVIKFIFFDQEIYGDISNIFEKMTEQFKKQKSSNSEYFTETIEIFRLNQIIVQIMEDCGGNIKTMIKNRYVKINILFSIIYILLHKIMQASDLEEFDENIKMKNVIIQDKIKTIKFTNSLLPHELKQHLKNIRKGIEKNNDLSEQSLNGANNLQPKYTNYYKSGKLFRKILKLYSSFSADRLDNILLEFLIETFQLTKTLTFDKYVFIKIQDKMGEYFQLNFRYDQQRDYQNKWIDQQQELLLNKNLERVYIGECKNDILVKFKSFKDKIDKSLRKINYQLIDLLIAKRNCLIFQGDRYRKEEQDKTAYIIKIMFPNEEDDEIDEEEIEIMNTLRYHSNIIQLQDQILTDEYQVIVLVKCQWNLEEELKLIMDTKQQFSEQKLYQMLFDLIDGLILFRIYNVLHLDIKLVNILVSDDKYYYIDFGISAIKKQNEEVFVKGYTPTYAPQEQLLDDPYNPYIDYSTDIYSLGKTLEKVINCYKSINSEEKNQEESNYLLNIIKTQMTQKDQKQKIDCFSLIVLILEIKYKEKKQIILDIYYSKIDEYFNKQIKYKKTNDIDIQNKEEKNYYNDNDSSCEYSQQSFNESKDFQESGNQKQPNSELFNNLNQIFSIYKQYLVSSYSIISNEEGCIQGSKKIPLYYYQTLLSLLNIKMIDEFNLLKYKRSDNLIEFERIAKVLYIIGLSYIQEQNYKKYLFYFIKSVEILLKIQKESQIKSKTLKFVYKKNLKIFYKTKKQVNNKWDIIESFYDELNINSFLVKFYQMIIKCSNKVKNYQDQLKYANLLLDVAQQQQGKKDHVDIAIALQEIGIAYFMLKDVDIASRYFQEVYEMYQRLYKGDHLRISQLMYQIGKCYQLQNDYVKAKQFIKYQVEILIKHDENFQIEDWLKKKIKKLKRKQWINKILLLQRIQILMEINNTNQFSYYLKKYRKYIQWSIFKIYFGNAEYFQALKFSLQQFQILLQKTKQNIKKKKKYQSQL